MDLQKQQEERQKFQDECVFLSSQHRHLLLSCATGVGKTLAVVRSIDASVSPKKWLILVPEILQVDNLKRDIEKHNFSHLLEEKIEDIVCYASLKKYKNSEFNIWCNEAHKLSEERENIVETIRFDQIISDSATVPKDVKARLWNICPYHEYVLSLKDAIERGILPEPSIYLCPIEVDDKFRHIPTKFGNKTALLTDRLHLNKFDKDIKYWQERYENEGWPQWISNRIIRLGLQRKKYLAELKTEAVKRLIYSLQDKRFICFTGSTEQCDELGKSLAVHSKKGKKHNLLTVDKFNNYEINQIYVNKMMREGMNLSVDCAILVQLDSGEDEGTSFLQKTGRALRSESPDIYILYIKDSHDERVFLKKALKLVDEKYIKTIQI